MWNLFVLIYAVGPQNFTVFQLLVIQEKFHFYWFGNWAILSSQFLCVTFSDCLLDCFQFWVHVRSPKRVYCCWSNSHCSISDLLPTSMFRLFVTNFHADTFNYCPIIASQASIASNIIKRQYLPHHWWQNIIERSSINIIRYQYFADNSTCPCRWLWITVLRHFNLYLS